MPQNREKQKERYKEWYQNNKQHRQEYNKVWYIKNKEHCKEYHKAYDQTEQGIKIHRINTWKKRGIKGDFEEIYIVYISTDFCHYCNVSLIEGLYGANKKCLDHDHETGEVRGIICHSCNVKDVLA